MVGTLIPLGRYNVGSAVLQALSQISLVNCGQTSVRGASSVVVVVVVGCRAGRGYGWLSWWQ